MTDYPIVPEGGAGYPICELGEQCPVCDGHGQDKWGESCNECHGDGVIYVDP